MKHQWLDPLVVAGPWLLAGGIGYTIVQRLRSGRFGLRWVSQTLRSG